MNELPMCEPIPKGTQGKAYLLGRDKDQNLVLWEIPAADKLTRSKEDGTGVYFSNT